MAVCGRNVPLSSDNYDTIVGGMSIMSAWSSSAPTRRPRHVLACHSSRNGTHVQYVHAGTCTMNTCSQRCTQAILAMSRTPTTHAILPMARTPITHAFMYGSHANLCVCTHVYLYAHACTRTCTPHTQTHTHTHLLPRGTRPR